ncbi:hypothetical protein TBLA_0B02250 [Henningerozyma blattae CBS 6284]|uniref:Large ribosomal subunit protein uL15/eL18 domain-containing protein n=1 Tax=Henningerozyma blattae (strain ATCC 34711 / CBS 6284 / DSM 70876 / NBRC 10599 / NRRL Y-10934 / UCD 77-7) TaxID=1071380 RepID=I2GY65_HENB6|nr:hypothetical protein TBLA_0B02250 [Tetrapisispora blattae CBS 6284]CCH59067.1 hypothetical protein TBLA_0B02250 [Tetrapisispora blattae CBS 6284]
MNIFKLFQTSNSNAIKRNYSILGNLKPSSGSTSTYKRVGRGPSSGKGKTSGRGQKGQKARGKVKPWFEGGQTPIYKLFPKVGFKNNNKKELKTVNLSKIKEFYKAGRLGDLQNAAAEGKDNVLDIAKMKKYRLVTGPIKDGVKILARGGTSFNIPLKIEASKATASAISSIEAAGGEFTSRYFSKLGLKAHVTPNKFLEKYDRVPLQARPTRRKDIEYYSDPERRGYLIKEDHPLLKQIQEAQLNANASRNNLRREKKKGALDIQLSNLLEDKDGNLSKHNKVIREIGKNSEELYMKR